MMNSFGLAVSLALGHDAAEWQAGRRKLRKERPKFDATNCDGCMRCLMQCPRNCIQLVDRPEDLPGPSLFMPGFNPQECNGCGKCAQACGENCIIIVAPATA